MKKLKAKLKLLLQRTRAAILWHIKWFWLCYVAFIFMDEYHIFEAVAHFILGFATIILMAAVFIFAFFKLLFFEGPFIAIKELIDAIFTLPEYFYENIYYLYPMLNNPEIVYSYCEDGYKAPLPDYWLLGNLAHIYVFVLIFIAAYFKKYSLLFNSFAWFAAFSIYLQLCPH